MRAAALGTCAGLSRADGCAVIDVEFLLAEVQSVVGAGVEASPLPPYFGNLHDALGLPWSGAVAVLCSITCGTLVGLERQARHKPAGLRTVTLICVGSTIFTIASILIAGDSSADRGRIAAQVVTGVGFLGAGAIIRERGHVLGLTTGATIWTVAAIGVLIGVGYAAAGLAVTLVVLGMLVVLRQDDG